MNVSRTASRWRCLGHVAQDQDRLAASVAFGRSRPPDRSRARSSARLVARPERDRSAGRPAVARCRPGRRAGPGSRRRICSRRPGTCRSPAGFARMIAPSAPHTKTPSPIARITALSSAARACSALREPLGGALDFEPFADVAGDRDERRFLAWQLDALEQDLDGDRRPAVSTEQQRCGAQFHAAVPDGAHQPLDSLVVRGLEQVPEADPEQLLAVSAPGSRSRPR